MSLKKIIGTVLVVTVAMQISEQFWYLMGVKNAVDSLDESTGVKEVTVKIPGTKKSTYTYRKTI